MRVGYPTRLRGRWCALGTQHEKNRDKQHKIYMANKRTFGTQRNLYSTGSRWGFTLGETQILGLALGVTRIFAFLDTKMLVYQTQNGFALQWNIGLRDSKIKVGKVVPTFLSDGISDLVIYIIYFSSSF